MLKYSLCAIRSTLTTPMSSFGWLLSSIPMSTVRITSSDKREIWTCTQFSYGPEPNPDMYAVLAAIQLMFGQEYDRANLLLLSTQIRRLLASESTSESHVSSDSDSETNAGILAPRRAMVDQAR